MGKPAAVCWAIIVPVGSERAVDSSRSFLLPGTEMNLLLLFVTFSFSPRIPSKPQVISSFQFCVLGRGTETMKA